MGPAAHMPWGIVVGGSNGEALVEMQWERSSKWRLNASGRKSGCTRGVFRAVQGDRKSCQIPQSLLGRELAVFPGTYVSSLPRCILSGSLPP